MASFDYTFTSGDTVTPTKLNNARNVKDIVNADIKSDAAIAGTKIAPNFGSQNVVTTGSATCAGLVTVSGAAGGDCAVDVGAGRTGNGFAHLDLIGDATYADYGLRIIRGNAGANATSAVQHRGTGALNITTQEAASVVVNTSNAERMRIDASGNVLVGATTARNVGASSPGGLQVEANLGAAIVANRNDTVGGILSLGKSRATAAGGTTVVQSGDTAGEIRFAAADGVDMQSYAAGIAAQIDGTPGADDTPGRLTFATTSDGQNSPTERMRITSAGDIGVNTTDPKERLHISGSGESALVTPIGYSANQNSAYLIAAPTTYTGATTNWGTFGFQHRIKSDAGGVPRLTIDDSSGERFTIQNGNVGIGNTNPTTRLVVGGTVTATAFAGPLTGDVTGNVTGNVTGTASAIADNTVSNAKVAAGAAIAHSKLANITAGQVLLGNASNVPTATALSGDVTVNSSGVTAIGSAKVLPAMLSQPYTLATAQNSTSGTSIDFTGIPSWARRITIMFDGVSTNGTSAVIVQVGDGSVVTSGYLGSGGTIINASTSNGVNRTNGFALDDVASASAIRHGTAVLTTLGTNKWVFSSVTGRSDGPNVGVGGGSVTLSGALDRVRVTTVGGTNAFDAGVINIAYE